MSEIWSQHSIEYRWEILSRFFEYVRSTESFYLVGAASMGKTRLLDFLTRVDVQKKYLGEKAEKHWLIRVNMDRLAVKNEDWAFYELLLSSIILGLDDRKNIGKLGAEIVQLDSEILQRRDPLFSLRLFELAVNKLCQGLDLKLCFLFDEFDEAYRALPREIFMQLRAIRDANKNRVSFGLFLRNLPERLRSPQDNESFYELISRNVIGLGPYTHSDAMSMIQNLEVRREHPLSTDQREKLFAASGGHPGLIVGIMSVLIESQNSHRIFNSPGWQEWISRQPAVVEECRKLWNGLSGEERDGLLMFARGEFGKISLPVEKILFLKGLLIGDEGDVRIFSLIFDQYVKSQK